MTKSVKLHLDRFGQLALEELADRQGDSPSSVVRAATQYYLADRDTGRAAWRVPRFARANDPILDVDIELDDETWTALAEEARAQAVDPLDLAQHAVLYFLADLDSGRLGERLEEALHRSEREP